MTEEEIAQHVKAAGMEATAARFPTEVREALEALGRHRAALVRNHDPALEPTPAFRAPAAGGAA